LSPADHLTHGRSQHFLYCNCPAYRSGRCPDNNCGDQGYARGYADRLCDPHARRPCAGSDAARPL